jgi:hypothetical protein
LLAFWSKKSEFPISVRRNHEEAIDFIGKDLSMKTKAENLEIMLQMMQAKIKDSVLDADETESENEIEINNLGSKSYTKINNLVISLNNPIFAKMYAEILCQNYVSIRTNLIYDLWKKNLLDNETLASALNIIIKIDKNKEYDREPDYFEKQVEMLKESKNKDLFHLMVKKIFERYSNISNKDKDKLICLQKAIQLTTFNELKAITESYFESCTESRTIIQENCKLTQVNNPLSKF